MKSKNKNSTSISNQSKKVLKKIQELEIDVNGNINTILITRQNKILVSGRSKFIFVYSKNNDKFEYEGKMKGFSSINTLYESKEDNKIYSGDYEAKIVIFNINTLQLNTVIDTAHFLPINKVIETCDKKIISCSMDKSIKIFEKSGKYLFTLFGHFSNIKAIMEIKNNILVSGSDDYTLMFWDLKEIKNMSEYTIKNINFNFSFNMIYLKDKDLLIVGGKFIISIIDINDYKIVKTINEQIEMGITIIGINQFLDGNIIVIITSLLRNEIIFYNSDMKFKNKINISDIYKMRNIVSMKENYFITSDYEGKIIIIWEYKE